MFLQEIGGVYSNGTMELTIRRFVICLVSLFLASTVFAQNVVPNGDFEKTKFFHLPRTLGALSGWFKINSTTPDYLIGEFHMDGRQKPKSGNAYIGLFNNNKNYVEYIAVKLSQTLKRGRLYCVSMYVNRVDNYNYAVDKLSFSLTANKPSLKGKGLNYSLKYQDFGYTSDSILRDKKEWMHLCATYYADGSEKYLTLGYLNPEFKIYRLERGRPYAHAYYFIDDVSVLEITDSAVCSCKYIAPKKKEVVATKDSMNIDSPVINLIALTTLNIEFSYNSYRLPQSAYGMLDSLADIIKSYTSGETIVVSGHTDSTGNEASNLKLSLQRAKAVTEYLTRKGVSKSRLSYEGHASTLPVASNRTEEGRRKNRRIEIRIFRK